MVLPPIAKRGESPVDEVLHVQKSTLIDHRAIRSAYVNTNYIAGYVVIGIEFSQQGKELLAKLTTENIGKRVAILIDGKLQSAPRIPSPITGGSIVVQGPFTVEEAQVLVGKIKRETSK